MFAKVKSALKNIRLSVLYTLPKVLPVIVFSRLSNEQTDAEKFLVPRSMAKPIFTGKFNFVIEVSASDLIIGAENNFQNGWFGYVINPNWIEVKLLPKKIGARATSLLNLAAL